MYAYLELDYRGEDIPLTAIDFNPGDVLKCIDIGIIDDDVVELPESFMVVVVVPLIGVQSSIQVNIEDDDGTCPICVALFDRNFGDIFNAYTKDAEAITTF